MGLNDAAEVGASLILPEFDRLEEAVRRLRAAGAEWQARARAAEERGRELQAALDAVRTGTLDPRELGERVAQLEAENETLRQRLRNADALVQRIHARLQLLEDEK
jgi:predicted RNase H-like nuclease (RuvC/YqgF family)